MVMSKEVDRHINWKPQAGLPKLDFVPWFDLVANKRGQAQLTHGLKGLS